MPPKSFFFIIILTSGTVLMVAGPLQESAVWIDESATCGAVFGRIRAASPIVSQDLDDPLGISDEASE